MDPLSFDFSLAGFDLSLLPADPEMLKSNAAMLRSSLQEYLRKLFERLPGESSISHDASRISVHWLPKTPKSVDSLMDLSMGLIRERAFSPAETILKTLVSCNPSDRKALFNLGAMLCDLGRVKEAREVLRKLTRTAPDFANGWNALGVALSREGKRKEALAAFRKSLDLDPENGTTLRNLGSVIGAKDPQEALPYLKRAAKLLPSDQLAQYAYGKCLMDAGSGEEADRALRRAVSLGERSEIADLCREARLEIVRKRLKRPIPRGVKEDVLVYCLGALETLEQAGSERTEAVVFEIASLGSKGLNIKDRVSRFRLLSMAGKFSALQLVVYMYVGLKRVDPQADPGIEFSKEYAYARRIWKGGRARR